MTTFFMNLLAIIGIYDIIEISHKISITKNSNNNNASTTKQQQQQQERKSRRAPLQLPHGNMDEEGRKHRSHIRPQCSKTKQEPKPCFLDTARYYVHATFESQRC